MSFNDDAMSRAIERSLVDGVEYDFCYAHFLPAGRAALKSMNPRSIPVFVNLGESDPWDYDLLYDEKAWISELSEFSGIITVSKLNQEYILQRNVGLKNKVRYIPNGIDTSRFKKLDKITCRTQLDLPQDEIIVIFAGHFEERKGPLRVLEAIRQVGIKGIFLGAGIQEPKGTEVIFQGSVVNEEIPLWLNAADVFVLPSLSEGMSNAILEALACGLPLVVSDRAFNREFLTKDCTIFVDPLNPSDIAKGIEKCIQLDMAEKMSEASTELAKTYSIEKRIKLIDEFVQDMISQ